MISSRPYQDEILAGVRQHLSSGVRRILIQAPTGAGKTVIAAKIFEGLKNKGNDGLFIVHRRELVKQSIVTFDKFGIPAGAIASGFVPEPRFLCQVCSIDTLRSRLQKLPRRPKLILWDEAHHLASKSWTKVFNYFPDAIHILLTATPERLDGKGLADYADVIVQGPSVRWLIENKFLADYIAYAPSSVDMSGVRKQMGDFSKAESVALVDRPAVIGSAVEEYKKLAYGKRCLGFAVTIEHSHHIVEEYKAAGIAAAHLDGETDMRERDRMLADFVKGDLKYISNVGLFSEGYDCPSLDALQMMRPTASLGMYLQMCGRPLRADGNKVAIILDHVGNIKRHGLPCEERQWGLGGREKRGSKSESDLSVKLCEKCYAAVPVQTRICPYCQAPFEVKEREIIKEDGTLEAIDKEKMRLEKRGETRMARSFEELVELGRSRGYKNPTAWAHFMSKARDEKRAKRGASA